MSFIGSSVDRSWLRKNINKIEDNVNRDLPTWNRKRGEKNEKWEQNIQELWDNLKRCNICVFGIPEGEKRGDGVEEIFEVAMVRTSPKLMTDIKTQIQEAQSTPNRINIFKNLSLTISYLYI